jgi:Ca2+-binding RTX toxin-like protein
VLQPSAIQRGGRIAIVLFLASAFLLSPVLNRAQGLTGCTVTQVGDTQVWNGDANPNYCDGGNGKDSMYGYGANDQLFGGTGADLIRGATGDDILDDTAGGLETDKTCDGSGADHSDVADGDGKDTIYWLAEIGDIATYDSNPGGDAVVTYTPNNCPI